MLAVGLDSATKVVANARRGKQAPHAGFYTASLRQSCIICANHLLSAIWTNPQLLTDENRHSEACSDLADSAALRTVFGGRGY